MATVYLVILEQCCRGENEEPEILLSTLDWGAAKDKCEEEGTERGGDAHTDEHGTLSGYGLDEWYVGIHEVKVQLDSDEE